MYQTNVNVKERIKTLEKIVQSSTGMTRSCYATQLALFQKMEQEGVEEIIEIDPYKDDLIACKSIKLGAKGLWIDPKGDRTNCPADLKSFGDQVNVTTFFSK